MLQEQKNQQSISNLKISSEVINISPEDQTGELTLTNIHQTYALLFKIKTKIEKIFVVKPTKGFILPGEKVVITFHAAHYIEQAQRSRYEKELQFLLQAANRNSHEITKQQQDLLWKSIKEKNADLSLGYCAVKIGISFSGSTQSKPFVPFYSNYESRIDNKFSSNVKSNKKASLLKQIEHNHQFDQNFKSQSALSDRYSQLKEEHAALQNQRDNLYSVKQTQGKNSFSIIKLTLVFCLFLLVGNYLKEILAPTPEPPKKQEKHWFSSILD